MPKTRDSNQTGHSPNKRITVRIPSAMIGYVDDICHGYPELGYNRQQFVQDAIREKIEQIISIYGQRSKKSES